MKLNRLPIDRINKYRLIIVNRCALFPQILYTALFYPNLAFRINIFLVYFDVLSSVFYPTK